MKKITDKSRVIRMTMLFMILYMISYMTRINYGAVISEMVLAEGIQKSAASLALTASAVTYGAGQILSGFMGDRTEPKKLIFTGLVMTIMMNLAIPFCTTTYARMAVWGVNGLAQAFMWPPLVKIMSALFTEEDYKKSCVVVTWGSSFGTVLVYLIAPICILLAGWKSIFFLSAAAAVVMSAVWLKKCPQIGTGDKKVITETNRQSVFDMRAVLIIGAIMAVIVLQGVLRDGVMTWIPSYVSETFNLSSKTAILTSVILPLFSIAALQLVSVIYRNIVKNELLLTGILFMAGCAAAAAMFLANGASAVASVILAALLNGCMHGVNLMLICMIPPYFAKYGRISFISGMLNFCTYIGSAVSASGLAAFSEKCGWAETLLLWGGIAFAGGTVCCILCRVWKRFADRGLDGQDFNCYNKHERNGVVC